MKILTLNHEFPPVGGGASPVSFELCRQLVRLGHQVDVVTMGFGDLPGREVVDGVTVYRTPALRKQADICHTHEMATYLPGALPRALGLARRNRYDIIHCHFLIPGGPLAYLVSRCCGIPFVVTCHGSDVPGYNPERFGQDHKLIAPAWHYLVHHAGMLISPSESLKNLILSHSQRARVRVVPNGIDVPEYHQVSKGRSILMCSRILARKGFQYALEAIKSMDIEGWQVNVIGEGPFLAELKRIAEGSRVPVKFWGWLDRADRRFVELYESSSIFVFTSEAENFPTVLLEAMAAGTAIITSTAGGCPEVVGDAALLVEPRDSTAIREKLIELVNSENLRNKLSAAAQKRVEKFAWPNVARKYLDCYRDILGSL